MARGLRTRYSIYLCVLEYGHPMFPVRHGARAADTVLYLFVCFRVWASHVSWAAWRAGCGYVTLFICVF